MKIQLQLSHTPSFQRIDAQPSQRALADEKQSLYSESYIAQHISRHTLAGYHATGTCKMGPVSDYSAVVDPELR